MRENMSAIVLAGGLSSRMGRSKSALSFEGVSLLQHQVTKLRGLGIQDIVVSGDAGDVEGVRSVQDLYPRRGPLGGIHAGLLAISNDAALVLAVDTPLVPPSLLETLADMHTGGITLTSCGEQLEPLIAVYGRELVPACEKLLQGENTSLRALLRAVPCTTCSYTGAPELLMNCNTPEEYAALLAYTAK